MGQFFYYESKEFFMNLVVHEQVAESADGVAVRNLITGFHAAEIRKSLAVDGLTSSATPSTSRTTLRMKMYCQHVF